MPAGETESPGILESYMYAVFRSGGKQYRASKGDKLKLERLKAEEGASIEFEEVLLIGEGDKLEVGRPFVSGGKVEAKVLAQGKHRKIDVVKFKRRQNYKRLGGHRQAFTEVEITGISGAPAGVSETADEAPAKEAKAATTKKKVTKKKAPAKKKTAAKKKAATKKVDATESADE